MLRKKLFNSRLVILGDLRRQGRQLKLELLAAQLTEQASTLLFWQIERKCCHGGMLQCEILNYLSRFSFKNLIDNGFNQIRTCIDLLPGNSHVVELGPFEENGHEAQAI